MSQHIPLVLCTLPGKTVAICHVWLLKFGIGQNYHFRVCWNFEWNICIYWYTHRNEREFFFAFQPRMNISLIIVQKWWSQKNVMVPCSMTWNFPEIMYPYCLAGSVAKPKNLPFFSVPFAHATFLLFGQNLLQNVWVIYQKKL